MTTADLITPSNITFVVGMIAIMFSVYKSLTNPQVESDKEVIRLREDMDTLHDVVSEIKEKHLASVEANIKELSSSVHELSINVTRLTTIIDERVPRQ